MSSKNDSVKFLPGLQLAQSFFEQAVRPILQSSFPNLRYAAALIGTGSEVLGFDDIMSTDHHWGPRLLLFLEQDSKKRLEDKLHESLAWQLPPSIQGYPTHWSAPDPEDGGNQFLRIIDSGPVNHRVDITTLPDFFKEQLSFDIGRSIEPADWLTFPEQRLRAVTAGAVFHDQIGLQTTRNRFRYYPRDVWIYLLAAGWARIGQEEHLMGRAGLAGDELGSAVIGARLARDIMRLCFLMERVYSPYPKWFGTAFRALGSGAELYPLLQEALAARTWQEREVYLVQGYEHLARRHNSLNLTEPLPETAVLFHGRPFRVVAFHGFSAALLAKIQDPAVRRIAKRRLIGSIDQFSDNTDLLSYPEWRPLLRALYESD